MAKLPYDRKFTIGRQSEQFMNDELHIVNESLKNINYRKNENNGTEPSSRVDGGLWLDKPEEALKYWDAKTFRWRSVFGNKFQIVDQLLNVYAPKAPVVGQLWLNSGVLMYFDGSRWQPVRTLIEDGTHWSGAAFEDFLIVSPLDPSINTATEDENNDNDKYDAIANTIKIGFLKEDWHKKQGEYCFTVEGDICGINNIYEEDENKNFTEVGCTVSILPNHITEIISPAPFKGFAIASLGYTGDKIAIKNNDDGNSSYIDTHKNTNFVEPSPVKWGTEKWNDPSLPERRSEFPTDEDVKRQYIVPNTYTDRIFVGSTCDNSFKRISSVAIEYPLKDVKNKIVSAIHLNPGRLIKIEKRLIKIDRRISTIEISAKDTEFYGFQSGRYTGDFLIESNSQEYGDYIPSGNHILLNYNTVQNYDYVLAVHYVFSWFHSTGTVDRIENSKKTFYLTNLQEPINVHVNGVKLEEASYNVDTKSQTVTLEDSTEDLDVQMWTPLRKQYGYIRETDLEGNGYIILQERVGVPLVFVGGVLIHPLYGGLTFEGNKIIVPNQSGIGSMRDLSWCVIDLIDEKGNLMSRSQGRTSGGENYNIGAGNYLDAQNNYHTQGELAGIDQEGYNEYILSSGKFPQTKDREKIYFDNNAITEQDGILLFVNGVMINNDDIIRHDEEGYLEIKTDIPVTSEYVVLKDVNRNLFNSAHATPAFMTGYLDESLVYLNGKLLANEGCAATTEPPAVAQTTAIHNEIRYFISEDDSNTGYWKIYDGYNMEWVEPEKNLLYDVKLIVSSYSNQLSSVKINVKYEKEDDIRIFAYHYSGSISGVLKYGTARFQYKESDGSYIYILGKDSYPHGQRALNVFHNGVKLMPNIEFKEIDKINSIRITKAVEPGDTITYVIEPIEDTDTIGHNTVVLGKSDVEQANIYTIGQGDAAPELYNGRLTVYINGIRLPKENWLILDSKRIMINTPNYLTVGSADNYPVSTIIKDNKKIEVINEFVDQIMIETRKDFDRKEKTIEVDSNTVEIYPEEYGITPDILGTQDEILFYLNGQFCNMTRNNKNDYKIDKVKGCITITSPGFFQQLRQDPLRTLFETNPLAYAAWKKESGKSKYISRIRNQLTIVWRG